MSDAPFDPADAQGVAGEPTEEEIRAYLAQLRVAPTDQVLAEVASAIINAAQVKLGRQDARLLIDVLGALTEQVRGVLADELTDGLDDALTQLRLAQVEAERQVAAAAAQGHQEQDDLPLEPAGEGAPGAAGADQGQAPPPQQPGPGAASRLWVPGR